MSLFSWIKSFLNKPQPLPAPAPPPRRFVIDAPAAVKEIRYAWDRYASLPLGEDEGAHFELWTLIAKYVPEVMEDVDFEIDFPNALTVSVTELK